MRTVVHVVVLVLGVTGQKVVLDDDLRIKFSTSMFFPMVEFGSFDMIIRDVGEKMHKYYRPRLPATSLRLLDMYKCACDRARAVEAGFTGNASTAIVECTFCRTGGYVFQCPLCMMWSHAQCAMRAQHEDAFARLRVVSVSLSRVPEFVQRFLCAICCTKV